MNFDLALGPTKAPPSLIQQLALLELPYVDLNGVDTVGQMIVHQTLASQVETIFAEIHDIGFPIFQMRPISVYHDDDDVSMARNNTSAFCYRVMAGTTLLSAHSKGAAIDVNPAFNPFDSPDGLRPEGAVYDLGRPGTLSRLSGSQGNEVIGVFAAFGWFWLGDRKTGTDRHHFEKIGYRDAMV